MGSKLKQGAMDGALVGILIILGQPFFPMKGLIPELGAFLTSLPLWIAAVLFGSALNPLLDGGVVLIYFILIGALLGVAFERKRLWGWFLVIALAIHHYAIYDQLQRPMGEVVQAVLNVLS